MGDEMTIDAIKKISKNTILYGPPGTGKTYNTVIKAMEIVTFKKLFSYWYLNIRKNSGGAKALEDYISHIEKISNEFNRNIFKYYDKDKFNNFCSEILNSDYIVKNDVRSKTNSFYRHSLKRYSEFLEWLNYDEILRAFNDEIKKNDGRIRFVTFHQSFSYEEFVEGIKPEIKNWDDEGQEVKYVGRDGIFKEICKQAQRIVVSSDKKVEDIDFSKVNIFKMSLNSKTEDVYGYCLENNVIALGWGGDKDFSECKSFEDIKNHQGSNEGASELNCFVNKMEKGDIVIISRGKSNFKAIAQITGNYECNANSELGFKQFRSVKWLYKGEDASVKKIYDKYFRRSSCYELDKDKLNTDVLNQIITGGKEVQETKEIQEISFDNLINEFKEKYPEGRELKTSPQNAKFEIIEYADDYFSFKPLKGKRKNDYRINFNLCEKVYNEEPKKPRDLEKLTTINALTSYYFAVYQELKKIKEKLNEKRHYGDDYVLVIDEINRGNISKIFGELITLIEEDKREKLSVVLPYSKETFTVPENLYIIGTMNTSDRSIASIDIALRRRFQFEGMYPNSDLVVDKIDGIDDFNFKNIFEKLNYKIRLLLDADHQIGHSYFMEDKIKTIEDLKDVWFRNILPLLNEYFYGDWDKLKLIISGFIKPENVPQCFRDYVDNLYSFYDENDFSDEVFVEKLKEVCTDKSLEKDIEADESEE